MADLSTIWDDDYDVDAVPVSSGQPDPVPVGEYTLRVCETELKMTKDGTGVMLSAMFEILDADYEGRKVFTNFNIRNKNEMAQKIGIGDLKALCVACGLEFADVKADTSLLHNIPFAAKVGLEKPREGYAQRNEIKKYHPAGGAAPVAAAPASTARPTPAKAAPAATRAAPAWMNKKAG